VLEYGPGDILGVALLLYAHGADRVDCVDRFELSKLSRKNILVYTEILKSLAPKERERAERAFNEVGNPESGFKVNAIQYKITKNGLSSDGESYDLVISRAVLEHVNDLESTILDIKKVLKTGGASIHQVDLKSHGLDRRADLDFLTWNSFLYRLMYSHKGFPNRWRVNKYREFASKAKLQIERMAATEQLGDEKVKRILPKVAKEFTKTSAEDLSWLGFWIVFKG
jgi:SAM-dependent methyltransferase